jgi:purine-nucleoside/S-methyl-5'-thioadenosine phosphorylase / adenosine deaminase
VWFGLPTRDGGVSTGPYTSLNLGLRVGDDEASVLENRRRFRAAAGLSDREPVLVLQVHGRRIVTMEEAAREGRVEADGLLVSTGDPWAGVSAADCAPVAVAEPLGRRAALLHAGWRGARDGIAAAAVELLRGAGFEPAILRAAIGPCLHACCFPIGPEVAAEFDPAHLRPHPSGQPSLDLPAAITAGLVAAGMARERIATSPECTSCHPERWFSHRRDGGVTGRHWALLRIEPR